MNDDVQTSCLLFFIDILDFLIIDEKWDLLNEILNKFSDQILEGISCTSNPQNLCLFFSDIILITQNPERIKFDIIYQYCTFIPVLFVIIFSINNVINEKNLYLDSNDNFNYQIVLEKNV